MFTAVFSNPCVLLLTYFAFGGDMPLQFRLKRRQRVMLVGIVFWISFFAALVVVGHFFPISLD